MAKEEIAGFYTRSRKFPKMIGRMTDGSRIPGGPYTFTQIGFGGATLLILLMTRTMWSTGGLIFDVVIVAGVAWGITKAVGYIPMTRRNLVLAFVDAVAAMLKPRGGRYQGQAVKLARPHQAVGKSSLMASARPETASEPAAEPIDTSTAKPTRVTPEKRPAPAVHAAHTHAATQPSHPPVSGVERLLQQTKSNK